MTTNWLNETELRAWRNLSLMQLQLTAQLSTTLSTVGLSYSDYLVLATLGDREDGRCRVVEIGRELGWEKSRVSHHVTRMCTRGLVTKERCPTDQRGYFVVLSEKGRACAEAIAPAHVADVRRLFLSQLSDSDLRAIDRIAEKVLAHLGREDRDDGD